MYEQKNGGRRSAGDQSKAVLVRALSERHPDLTAHSADVSRMAELVARELDVAEDQLEPIRHAAELHDVGKVGIPDAILTKPGALDAEEWAFMRRHTIIGERIIAGAPALAQVGRLVRSSHERWDGTGYPDELARRGDPDRLPDHRRLRRLRRHGVRAPLQAGAQHERGAGRAAALRRHAVRPGRGRGVLRGIADELAAAAPGRPSP